MKTLKNAWAVVAAFTFVLTPGMLFPTDARDVIATLNAAMRKTLQMPDMRKLLEARGYDIVGSTPEAYGANIRSEMARWEKVARETKLERLN